MNTDKELVQKIAELTISEIFEPTNEPILHRLLNLIKYSSTINLELIAKLVDKISGSDDSNLTNPVIQRSIILAKFLKFTELCDNYDTNCTEANFCNLCYGFNNQECVFEFLKRKGVDF